MCKRLWRPAAEGSPAPRESDSAKYRGKKTNTGYQFYQASMENTISEHGSKATGGARWSTAIWK